MRNVLSLIAALFFSVALFAQTPYVRQFGEPERLARKKAKVKTSVMINERYDSISKAFISETPGDTLSFSKFDREGHEVEYLSRTPAGIDAQRHWWRYDSKGNLIRHLFVDCKGVPCDSTMTAYITAYVYDAAGKLVQENSIRRQNGKDSLRGYNTFFYGAGGLVNEERRFLAQDGKYVQTELLHYSIMEKDRKVVVTRYDPAWNFKRNTDTLVYDSLGRITWHVSYYHGENPEGVKTDLFVNTFSPEGFAVCHQSWNYDLLTKKVLEYPLKCDSLTFTRKRGRLIEMRYPAGYNKFFYNKRGRQVEMRNYSASGTPLGRTRFVETYY